MAMFSFNFDYAHWVIEQIQDELTLNGQPLTDQELKFLRTPVFELREVDRPGLFQLSNRLVPVIRARIERQKAVPGVGTVRARRGLRLPAEWDEAYKVIVGSNLDWFISTILQNAILKNDQAGEGKLWKSK